jgi:cytochrome b subunit of formate dehydrogenase
MKQNGKSEYFIRFATGQRIEHIVLMITFTALAVTGLAQKYYTSGWGEWLILSMGGIAMTRLIHRILGVIFTLSALYHIGFLIYYLAIKRGRATMLPNLKDVSDIVDNIRHALGLQKKPAMFGRYDYRQKFEYWGILFGGTIMIVTGLILMYPIQATSFLPGQLVAAAHEAHGNEAMLAVLTIVIWHLYDVMFRPDVFPADTTMFTGKIPKWRMKEEHPLEYARLTGEKIEDIHGETTPAPQATAPTSPAAE